MMSDRDQKQQTSAVITGSRLFILCLILQGCGYSGQSAKVEEARRQLQLNRPQLTIDLLAKVDTAEAHYLRAIALQALEQGQAARDQIGEALALDSEDPKFNGYLNLLDLAQGRAEAATKLIDLYTVRPSSPGVAFFATRAFLFKRDMPGAMKAFKLGLSLIDDVPEFMFNAMNHAANTNQGEAVSLLIGKLEKIAPKDPEFIRSLLSTAIRARRVKDVERLLEVVAKLEPESPDLAELRIRAELMMGRNEAAVHAARQVLDERPNDEQLELMLAESLLQASPKPSHEKQLAELAQKHQDNPEFLAKYVLYLTQIKQLPKAIDLLNRTIDQTANPVVKSSLLQLAVGLPLESGDPVLAEKQVDRYQKEFTDPLMQEYFQARLQFLKNDLDGALARFRKVIEQAKENTTAHQALTAECVNWQHRILQQKTLNEKLGSLQEVVNKSIQSKTKGQQNSSNKKSSDVPVSPQSSNR